MSHAPKDRERDVFAIADTLRKRAPVLERLADASCDQRDLRDDLEVSRSTVYKALTELEDAGLVVDRGGEYALTGFGRLAWQRHDGYMARLSRLDDARRLLEAMPNDQRLPLSAFEHARIIVPGRHAPERPLDRMEEFAERADRIRVVSPAGMPRYFADIHEDVIAGEQRATLVVENEALSRLRSGYDRFEEATDTSGLDVRTVEDELPFAVIIFDDDRLGLFAYEGGMLVGVAFTDDDAALSWGETVFERILERSDVV